MFLSQRLSAALACLAVILHLFLAPLSGTLAAEDKRALGLGGHCETALKIQAHAQHASSPVLAPEAPTEQRDDVLELSAKCCCGASAMSLATLLMSAYHPPSPLPRAHGDAQRTAQSWVMPHWHWPKLHPRAPPLV